jgi:hypothetical protein
MANADKNFDQYFKDKLGNHEIKPSKLAWERLDSQLGKKSKSVAFPIMRIAAAIILLLGAAYIIWQVSRTEEISGPQTAEVIQIPEQEEILESNTEAQLEEEIKKEEEVNLFTPEKLGQEKAKKAAPVKPQGIRKTVTERPKELLAENTTHTERNQEEMISIPEIELPELKMTEAVAMNNLAEEEEVVEYKITIKSRGLKDEPQKQGLIGGIEEKVDKIGGFLNKVEQGFADLQDAKENLFASNVPRKERSK